jgi:hypothetical protein
MSRGSPRLEKLSRPNIFESAAEMNGACAAAATFDIRSSIARSCGWLPIS